MKFRPESVFLVLLTIFSLLFLLCFQSYSSARSQLRRYEKILEAYKLYVNERYEEFEKYVDENDLRELKKLRDDLKNRLFERYYVLGIAKFHAGDFSSAVENLKKALQQLDQDDQRRAELIYFIGQGLMKAGRISEAKFQLSAVLDMPNSLYRTQAIYLLIDLYKQTGEKEKAEQIAKTYGEALK